MNHQLHHGDCLEVLKTMPDNSVDSIVTDPPYGLSFMGKKWDYDVPSVEVWAECLRVLKPGGHLLAFAGTRTQHRMAVRIEDAGFEIRDMIAWVYGSGFPKSLDVSKAIDKAAGAEREVTGSKLGQAGYSMADNGRTNAVYGNLHDPSAECAITAPATEAARQWQGWGTALKPALEPITMARKPLGEKTVAANVLEHGTGAINVDGCRVESGGVTSSSDSAGSGSGRPSKNVSFAGGIVSPAHPLGRWPANLIHDGSDEVVGLFPVTKNGGGNANKNPEEQGVMGWSTGNATNFAGDSGSAARFFYCAKASKKDRNKGLDSSRTVKHTTGLCKEENMELAELLQKATCESTVKWSIDESGASITGLCLLDSLSTTLTAINKITTLQICSLLMPSHTNESIAGANCETERGGSLVANAVSSNQSQLNTMSASQVESALGVSHAVSKMLSSISDGANWIPATNFHATVKPTALMRYLCRLVTPSRGIVLDPFMGSGSTGKAAMLEGFQFIGIERDAEYLQIAKARIEREPAQKQLL
jgi:site-specific DNA-methyltransferase (adenine-specific)